MNIEYHKQAVKVISTLDRPTKQRVKLGIEGLTEKPPKGDIKALQGYDRTYRLRIGKLRIIYEHKLVSGEEIIYIKDIGFRGDIYK